MQKMHSVVAIHCSMCRSSDENHGPGVVCLPLLLINHANPDGANENAENEQFVRTIHLQSLMLIRVSLDFQR